MRLQLQCTCGYRLELDEASPGSIMTCPSCGQRLWKPPPVPTQVSEVQQTIATRTSLPEQSTEPVRNRDVAWVPVAGSGLGVLLIGVGLFWALAGRPESDGTSSGDPGLGGAGEKWARGGSGGGKDVGSGTTGKGPGAATSREGAGTTEASAVRATSGPQVTASAKPETPTTNAEGEEPSATPPDEVIGLAQPKPKPAAPTAASPAAGRSGRSGQSWGDLLGQVQRRGLDVMLVFDSTGSMGGIIAQVKKRMERIARTLQGIIPKTRIGICTYRDEGDEYVVRGLPLTSDLTKAMDFLSDVTANGGGDAPEAVHSALEWAVAKGDFHQQARNVILLFGDAPPHPQHLTRCEEIAHSFMKQKDGFVNTITCHTADTLPDFDRIAQAGGGESFSIGNEREIVEQLVVLMFGSEHREKVLEAMDMLGDESRTEESTASPPLSPAPPRAAPPTAAPLRRTRSRR